jgi:N-dimethylarginine dimethylaminohydrolase
MPKTILMCPPEHFDIEYEINPCMHVDNQVLPEVARQQWQHMVFTANGALVIEGRVALPRFRHPERQGEAPYFEAWFHAQGFATLFTPVHDFEGEGDALLWNDIVFAGFPWCSDKTFTVVDPETVALYPKAFIAESLQAVRAVVPSVIEATDDDAMAYGLNTVSDGHSIVISDRATNLIDAYWQRGMHVYPAPIGEFQKSGGGAKCLSLEVQRASLANQEVDERFERQGLSVLRDVDPCPARNCGYSGSEGQSAVFADWNGGALATDYSKLGGYIVNGGGHGEYYGNERRALRGAALRARGSERAGHRL